MKIVHCIPISRGISKERLSYLSADDVPAGSIVSVPLRKRTVPAIVIETQDAEDHKAELKASAFALKKIGKVSSPSFLSAEFMDAIGSTADYFATTRGALLSLLVPKLVLEEIRKIKRSESAAASGSFERIYIQAHEEERLSRYRSLIREEFARKRSIFFVLPTIEDIRRFTPLLEKGIENYTFALHSSLSGKEMIATWNKIAATDHSVLVIGTPQFLSLHRGDFKTIVVERESSRSYKTQVRPYVDARVFIDKLAEYSGARLVLGDRFLRVETIHEARGDEGAEVSGLKFRSLSPVEVRIVDMRPPKDEDHRHFRVFGDELLSLIEETRQTNGNLFLFGARKGYATSTVCADCGTLVRCTNCGAPVVLYQKTVEENYFFCNKCGERRNAHERCATCTSWNLTMLGIGIERAEEELRSRFPGLKVWRLDKESVTTEKRALEIVARFYETPGSVLLGTELALIYLHSKIANTAVISIDPLFSVPDFRINEKLFHILLQIRDLAERRSIIQTRQPEEKVFGYAAQGNLLDFYRDEIEARRMFQYPPFSLFVKVSLQGPRAEVESEMRKVKKFLEPFQADLIPSFDAPGLKSFSMHALLKIKKAEWPEITLIQKLRALPPQFRVKVDPDTLV